MASGGENSKDRFSGGLLLKNTSLNVLGQIVPILVALFSMPLLISRLGSERFGVLMLAWMCLGYFNLFDFGLSRALTKSIAERLDSDREDEVPTLFWTTISATAFFGACGALVLGLSAEWLTRSVLKIPDGLEREALVSLRIIAACLPFVIMTTGFKGLLEATQSFLQINKIQIPMGLAFYILPLAFSFYSVDLPLIIVSLFFARIGGWLFFARAAVRAVPKLLTGINLRPQLLPDLFRFGGWVTVSNVLSPLIGYGDRFLIGAFLSMSAVTYYSTPYEIVNKLWIFPGAVMSVVFPALASYLTKDPKRAGEVYQSATKLLFGVLVPFVFMIVLFSREGLRLWAGEELAMNSTMVMEILGIAVLFNCFGMVPAALLDAMGKPKIPALLHAIELPIYFGALALIIPRFGLEGAALVWIARNALDTSALYLAAQSAFTYAKINWKSFLLVFIPLVALFSLLIVFDFDLLVRTAIFVVFAFVFPPWLWFSFFSVEDRRRVLRTVSSFFKPVEKSKETEGRSKVGVAVAAYLPDDRFFERQLESIQQQDYQNWFCVVSMDSELDFSKPWMARFKSDVRFEWVKNEGPRGVKSNFQNAVKQVLNRGADMIAFSDQDDVWYSHKLSRLVEELKSCQPLSLVHSNMHVFTYDSELEEPLKLRSAWELEKRVVVDYTPFHFLLRNTVTGASCLFDSKLGRLFETIPESIDFHDHWIALVASLSGEVRAVHEPLYAYRQHGRNVVGVMPFAGLFVKPEGVSWFQGIEKSIANWGRMRRLVKDVRQLDLSMPVGFAVFRTCFGASVFLISFAILNVKDDPTLARSSLVKGIGAGFSLFKRKS